MRLDLFLKTSRLIKRRTVAREMCDNGRVLVNDREAKPAREIKQGDTITLKFARRIIALEVLSIPADGSRKRTPEEFYRVTSETRLQQEDILWSNDLSSS